MKHEKSVNLPSTTEVLAPWAQAALAHVPSYRLDYAADRGTRTHDICAAICQNVWVPSVPKDCKGYVDSFLWWHEHFVDEVLLVETELVDYELGFCGHPDLIVRSSKLGGVILPDLKTPVTKNKLWIGQLAGYKRLADVNVDKWGRAEDRVDRIGSLQLDPDGRPAKFNDYTAEFAAAFAAFYSALMAGKYFGLNQIKDVED